MNLTELETELNKIDLTKYNNFKLSNCMTILNAKSFVDVSVLTLKNNAKKRAYLPTFERLINFYNMIK